MQILGCDENGNPTINYDSNWRYPNLFGFTKEDPAWRRMQGLYTEFTGIQIDVDGKKITE